MTVRRKLPKISVIIPARPGTELASTINALKNADYPSELVEIILVYGFAPSRQRNEAVKQAGGEIIYFLDNDSRVPKEALRRVVDAFEGKAIGQPTHLRGFSLLPRPICRLLVNTFFHSGETLKREVVAVGGPNIWRGKESYWSSLAGIVLESFFAHWKMSSRYRPIGSFRKAGEKEVILCNLAMKKNIFIELGGFREELYPNEENEFINRLLRSGYDCVYHPGLNVFRPRRHSLGQILTTFASYGRGRMEQVKVEGLQWSWVAFAPLALLFYLLSLLFFHPVVAFLPLIFYLTLGFASALGFAARRHKFYLAFFLPFFFLVVHLAYATGIIIGMTTDLERRKRLNKQKVVEIRKVKTFKGHYQEQRRYHSSL